MPKLKALGGLKLEAAPFTRPTPLLLLAYLSLEGPQQRKHLAELFWQEGNRMKNLSMTLTRLRQGAGEVVQADAKRAWSSLQSDAQILLEALDKSDWQRASELYIGAFLEGVVLDDWSSELEEWVYTTREYLAERVQYALLNLAENAASEQNFDKTRALAERAYKLPGLSTTDVTHLKRLYPLLCAGRSLMAPEARKELEEFGLSLTLGTEAAQSMFKPVLTPKSTLPVRSTTFVGRDEELTKLATLLSKPEVSLLTLLGPAGVGKTRLSLQLAHEQSRLNTFKDGVYFVALDALSDTTYIYLSLLSQLGVSPQGQTEPFSQLTNFIAEKHIFIVLDNFEHLTEGAGLLADLLHQCPNLKLLVTSRERLKLKEEHLYTLEGLAYPATLSEDAHLSEAVQLFKERAQQVQPHFELGTNLTEAIQICKLVEGLPLGIELAASWVRLMSCQEIASEIEKGLELLATDTKNVPERHRSLKAAFEQSWKLLTNKEQEVLRKLSVFVGGFRREAASEVTGATIPVLASLVDKSLLKVLPNGRYDRHPLLYQFTREKLQVNADECLEAQEKHARYYLTFTQLADSHLQGKEQISWFGRLDEEVENLRIALNFFEANECMTEALDLATSLGYFWDIRGYYTEGIDHLKLILAKTTGHSVTRVKALMRMGNLLSAHGEHQQAQHCYEQSLEGAKALNEPSLQAQALLGLGSIAKENQGDLEKAKAHFQSALEIAGASGNKSLEGYALRLLGGISSDQGDYVGAKTYYETAIRLYETLGSLHDRAKCSINLSTVLSYLGDPKQAHTMSREALELFRTVGDKYGMGIALLNLGWTAEERDWHTTIAYYEESLQLYRTLGNKHMMSHLLNNLAGQWQKHKEPYKAKLLLEESLAIRQTLGPGTLTNQALLILGQVQHDLGNDREARQTYDACITLCRDHQDNWALMRVLEVSARLYLQEQNHKAAERELTEAFELAERAGDKNTLQKILETQAALKR